MKLPISASILLCAFTTLATANQNPTESPIVSKAGKLYIGAFGGGGASNDFNGSQHATAFIIEAAGGPLAVNAFAKLDSENPAFLGAQLGYQAPDIVLNASSQWTLGPAFELEGYTTNRRSVSGEFIHNTPRIEEHDFLVSFPTRRTMLLANAILNFNKNCFPLHPYIGFGIGNAIVRISDADATQIEPAEVGVNHYNTNTSDTNATFAGQFKLGFSYDISKHLSFFADYRWLYLANSHFLFGSTAAPNHAPTSSWQVKLDAQQFHLGNIGIRFNV